MHIFDVAMGHAWKLFPSCEKKNKHPKDDYNHISS